MKMLTARSIRLSYNPARMKRLAGLSLVLTTMIASLWIALSVLGWCLLKVDYLFSPLPVEPESLPAGFVQQPAESPINSKSFSVNNH